MSEMAEHDRTLSAVNAIAELVRARRRRLVEAMITAGPRSRRDLFRRGIGRTHGRRAGVARPDIAARAFALIPRSPHACPRSTTAIPCSAPSIPTGISPREQGIAPAEQGIAPVEQGIASREQGIASREQGKRSRKLGIPTVEQGKTVVDQGITCPGQEGGAAATRGSRARSGRGASPRRSGRRATRASSGSRTTDSTHVRRPRWMRPLSRRSTCGRTSGSRSSSRRVRQGWKNPDAVCANVFATSPSASMAAIRT